MPSSARELNAKLSFLSFKEDDLYNLLSSSHTKRNPPLPGPLQRPWILCLPFAPVQPLAACVSLAPTLAPHRRDWNFGFLMVLPLPGTLW